MSTVSFVLYLELTVEFGALSLKGSYVDKNSSCVHKFCPPKQKKGLLIN